MTVNQVHFPADFINAHQPRAATARAGSSDEQRLPSTARARSLVALSSQGVSAVQPCRGRGWHSPQQCNRALCGAGLASVLPRCRNARRRAVHLSEAAGALSGAWGASPARSCVCKVGVREARSTRAQLPAPRWAPSLPHSPVCRPEQAKGSPLIS